MSQPVTITGRKVLIWMLMFFGLIFAVNGTFFYLAIDSWPGLVTEKPYESGLAYNQTLDGAEKQTLLGWQSTIDVVETTDGHTITATFVDKNGQSLHDLNTHAILRRPVNDVENLRVTLIETSPGQYSAALSLPARGRWYVDLKAARGADTYRNEHEIMVSP